MKILVGTIWTLFGCVVVPLREFRPRTPGPQSLVMLKSEPMGGGYLTNSRNRKLPPPGVHHTQSAPSRAEIKEQSQPSTVVPLPPGPPPSLIPASQPPADSSTNVNPSGGLEEKIKKKRQQLTSVTI